MVLVAWAMGNLWAGNVSLQTAQHVGQQFLGTTVLGQERAAIQLQLVSTAATRGEVDYYAFNVDGGGFVIIAGDDRVKPILAYSTTGSFNPEDIAEGFAFTLESFCTEIHYVREHNLTATPDIVAEWQSVTTTGSLNRGGAARAVVGPLCQTIWNQNFPWNSQCPEDPEGNGGHVYAGCVATAMGQVMKYYDWPPRGTGSYSYNPSGYAQQTANFGETDYHFELMPLALDSTSTEEDYFYIAQFLHHCGIAVDMQYSGNGSGAYSESVPDALSDYFRYSSDSHITNYSYWGWGGYTNEQWSQMLKDGGLDEHIPLYYSGSDDSGAGGHAFVCDGYDENDYFHFNWGWSGRDDAWCPIGALNTTKYAFNTFNGFTGHIIPNSSEYLDRPEEISDFTIVEGDDMQSVNLSWTNPSNNLNGNPLGDFTVYVYRNNEIIYTSDGPRGEAVTFTDENLNAGLYKYSVIAQNEAGYSRRSYLDFLVGEKCEITFVLHDEGGNGWKGAAISVTSEAADGQRIAVVTMEEGAEQTVTLQLLKGNANFIWNHGWYHTTEQYDTDSECSFSVFDAEGNELFVSGELEDGVFLTHDIDCEDAPLACYPVNDLNAEYVWHSGEEYGASLAWNQPEVTMYLDHFNVYREVLITKELELVAGVSFTGLSEYEFFDNLKDYVFGEFEYQVTSVYTNGEDICESDPFIIALYVTDIAENTDAEVKVYPNPTKGMVTIEGAGHLTVVNTLGQTVRELDIDGQTTMELPKGVFFVKLNGVTNKVVVE